MTVTNQAVAVKKGLSTLARARFGPGMLLQHDDLEQLNVYTRELSRLMFRSLFGCGVICGLTVTADTNCGKITVGVAKGVALDCCGDPVYVPQAQTIVIDEACVPDGCDHLWIVLCGTEKCCAPRTSMCAPDDDEADSVCTRERDGFEIRVLCQRPPCVCGCPEPPHTDVETARGGHGQTAPPCACVDPEHPCYREHYAGTCGCNCPGCSDGDCDCVLLAKLDKGGTINALGWRPDHSVRRFIRPVLMSDPALRPAVVAAADTNQSVQATAEARARRRRTRGPTATAGPDTTSTPTGPAPTGA
jgi:hypothetical protein